MSALVVLDFRVSSLVVLDFLLPSFDDFRSDSLDCLVERFSEDDCLNDERFSEECLVGASLDGEDFFGVPKDLDRFNVHDVSLGVTCCEVDSMLLDFAGLTKAFFTFLVAGSASLLDSGVSVLSVLEPLASVVEMDCNMKCKDINIIMRL